MSETRKKTDKREMILKVASEVFSRFGFEKTTLEDIGTRCRLNKASLYYYFKNKEDLFVAVVLAETAVFIEDLQAQTQTLPDTQAKTLHYLTMRIRRYEEVLNATQLSLDRLQQVEPIFDQLYQTIKDKEILFLEQMLNAGVQQGDIQKTDTKTLAESLFLISDALKHHQVMRQRAFSGEKFDYQASEKQLTLIIELIFKGLKK
ncbi:MAG: TetR/AcrR family transcriptional regulator [Saprospiraceae bacterium]